MKEFDFGFFLVFFLGLKAQKILEIIFREFFLSTPKRTQANFFDNFVKFLCFFLKSGKIL